MTPVEATTSDVRSQLRIEWKMPIHFSAEKRRLSSTRDCAGKLERHRIERLHQTFIPRDLRRNRDGDRHLDQRIIRNRKASGKENVAA